MSTDVVVADWINRLVEDERQRDAARAREEEAATRKADLVRARGRRLIEDLRATVMRDVDAFRQAFAGDPRRAIAVEDTTPEGGFVVRKPNEPAATLTVAPHVEAATVRCLYQFTSTAGMPPREQRVDLVFAGVDGEAPQVRHDATGQVFSTADALSEFLLVPVLTGRLR